MRWLFCWLVGHDFKEVYHRREDHDCTERIFWVCQHCLATKKIIFQTFDQESLTLVAGKGKHVR